VNAIEPLIDDPGDKLAVFDHAKGLGLACDLKPRDAGGHPLCHGPISAEQDVSDPG